MKRSTLFVAALAGLAAAGCQIEPGAPSTIGQGRYILTGKVTNLTGTALQNVTVQAQPVGGGAGFRTMSTNSAGIYRTIGMAPGSYRVVVVMGDSSRITSTGFTELFVGNADSTIAPVLTYDPGRVISGSITWSVQDTLASRSVAFRGAMVRLSLQATPTVFIDSIRTSATGAVRFAVRPGSYRITVDTTGFRAFAPAAIPDASLINFLNISASFSANVTSTASASITYRPPYQIRARIFKDRNGDGIYRANAADPDTVISGVRFWLRRAGSTANLGSSTVTSGTGTTATGNILFTGLDNAAVDGWALHAITWYLPVGCTLAQNDVAVTGDLSTGTVPTKDIPVTCP